MIDGQTLAGLQDAKAILAAVASSSAMPAGWQLADLRAQNQPWEEIAQAIGGTPQGRRKQLERAVDRVAQELGLEDAKDA